MKFPCLTSVSSGGGVGMYVGYLFLDKGTKPPIAPSYPVSWSSVSSRSIAGEFIVDFLLEGGVELVLELVFGFLNLL